MAGENGGRVIEGLVGLVPAPRSPQDRSQPTFSKIALKDCRLSLADARRLIDEEDRTVYTQVVSDGALLFAPGGRFGSITYGCVSHPLAEDGFESVCRHFGAPTHYLTNLVDEDLRIALLNRHARGIASDRPVRAHFREGQVVRLDDGLLNLSGRTVLDTVIEGIGTTNVEIQAPSIHGGSICLKIIDTKNLSREPAPGDVVQAGLSLSHSLLGTHATWMESWLFRLVCSNGLLRRECAQGRKQAPRVRRLPATETNSLELQRNQIRNLAAQTWGLLSAKLDDISVLQEQRIDDVPRFLRTVLGQARFRQTIVDRAVAAWESGPPVRSRWAALNAITSVATHDLELSDRHRRALMLLAGILLGAHHHLCRHCYSTLTASLPGLSADETKPVEER